MLIRFTKMHGLGNDFVVIDLVTQRARLTADKVRAIADRRFGVGCDQLLVVEPPSRPDVDFRYRIYNQDGSEVEQCGNGARCFAKFVRDRKLTAKRDIVVETAKGVIRLSVLKNNHILVDMGEPFLVPSEIPFEAPTQANCYPIEVDGKTYEVGAVSMGNPHVVLMVDDVDTAPVETLGPLLESHPRFPARVNVGFMQIINHKEAKLRVFERGVGETLACGSGACAAMVAACLQSKLDTKAKLHLTGGSLKISWDGIGHPVKMSGPATTVFHGQLYL